MNGENGIFENVVLIRKLTSTPKALGKKRRMTKYPGNSWRVTYV
jgi:hypothetical protein